MANEDYEPQYQPPHYPYLGKTKRGRKRLLIVIASILCVVIVAVVLWLALSHKPAAKQPANRQASSPAPQRARSPQTAATLQTFKSQTLNMQLTYRKDWTLAESADKKEVIVTSPSVTYRKSDKSSVTGPFTIKIREDVPDAMQSNVIKMVASQDSVVIAYTQPTAQQRQYTNLSFAGASPTVFNFLMVTGNATYKTGQSFGAGIDLSGTTYLIAGGYGTDTSDTLAFDSVPTNQADSTVYEQAQDIIKSLQIY